MTLSWVKLLQWAARARCPRATTYIPFALGLTQIPGSHLLASIESIPSQIHSLLFFRKFRGVQLGFDLITEQQTQAIVSMIESST